MRRVRVIPTLLIDRDMRLVKTVKFGRRTYIGDPMNAVRIFNEKEVDELILLDIDATREAREPNYTAIEDIVSEAFMPVAYGGGLRTIEHIERLFQVGIEKVVLSASALERPSLLSEAADRWGSQAIAVCLPAQRSFLGGYQARVSTGDREIRMPLAKAVKSVADAGAGELIVYSRDRDGTFKGYDQGLLRLVSRAVSIPVVACGGASSIADMARAINQGRCHAVAAGSIFVYQGRQRGVLITYPAPERLARELYGALE